MIKTILMMLASFIFTFGAFAADDAPATGPVDDLCRATANCDYEIRERFLSIPVWIIEVTRAQRTLISGEMRFRQQGYTLIADVDVGWKYQVEVAFVEGGVVFKLASGDRKYVQVDDAYQAIQGTYIYTIRPPR
jgi:hypothetical protein